MIRAVLKDGAIQPLDPLPPEWRDGESLVVENATRPPSPLEVDRWYDEMNQVGASIAPEDFLRLDVALAEADKHAKEAVRLQMGLPS